MIASLTDAEVEALTYEWRFWARPNQIAPDGDWLFWLLLAGRGFGKTRTAGEWINERVLAGSRHLILAGPTAGDVRDIMVDGESGILAKAPPWNRPHYEPSKARLTWPGGAVALLLSADKPDRFRGKQSDTVWCEELASWRYPDAWDQILLGLRLGAAYGVTPRGIISTTPRPTKIIKSLAADDRTVITKGSTYENTANLDPKFMGSIVRKYEGSRLGRQELYAEILDDAPGALWKRTRIDDLRVAAPPRQFTRICVAVDPAVSTNAKSDETGIVVVGVSAEDGQAYVLDDQSGVYTPEQWGAKVVEAFSNWEANVVVAETNQGGDLVVSNIAMAAKAAKVSVPVRTVHASRGKATRAEPVSTLYEQGRVHHVGSLPVLEDQLVTWEPSLPGSPDRLDALVWAVTFLLVLGAEAPDMADLAAFQKAMPKTRWAPGAADDWDD